MSDLEGGLTNRNLKVVTEAGAFVVRLWSDDGALLAIDRDNEHTSSLRAAATGVGAPVVAYLPEHNALVIEFVAGRTLSAEDLRGGFPLPRIAAAVRTLHTAEPFENDFDMFEIQRRYLELVDRARLPAPGPLRRVRTAGRGDPPGPGRSSGGAGPVQQRPPGRELHRRRRSPLADRLRVLRQQRAQLRARQHLERVGPLPRPARGARRRLLRRAAARRRWPARGSGG